MRNNDGWLEQIRALRSENYFLEENKYKNSEQLDRALLTLSSGAIVLSITFLKILSTNIKLFWILKTSWLFFIISILSVLFCFRVAIAQLTLLQKDLLKNYPVGEKLPLNKYDKQIKYLNNSAVVAFVIGILLLTTFGAINLNPSNEISTEKESIDIQKAQSMDFDKSKETVLDE